MMEVDSVALSAPPRFDDDDEEAEEEEEEGFGEEENVFDSWYDVVDQHLDDVYAFDSGQVTDLVYMLRDEWLNPPAACSKDQLREWTQCRLRIGNRANPSAKEVEEASDRVVRKIAFLHRCFDAVGEDPYPETSAHCSGKDERSLLAILNRALEVCHYATKAVLHETVAWERLFNSGGTLNCKWRLQTYVREGRLEMEPPLPTEKDRYPKKELTAWQTLYLHTLSFMSEKGYRRVGEYCYREIQTPDGYLTHAWEEHLSIRSFVHSVCTKEVAWKEWKDLTASKCNNVEELVRYLRTCEDPEFPELKTNRNVFAFEDGIYMSDQDMFYEFRHQDEWTRQARRVAEQRKEGDASRNLIRQKRLALRERGMEWSNTEGAEEAVEVSVDDARDDAAKRFPRGVVHESDFPTYAESGVFAPPRAPTREDVAAMYFPCSFYGSDAPEQARLAQLASTIETPEIDSLMDIQKLDQQTKEWLFAMLGRCLYDVGSKDNWQVILFIKGIAGSGKSTLANALRLLYPPSMVGTLSSNTEEKFGLQSIYDKLVFICQEVRKKNWSLDQGALQSMITGEAVSVAVKNEKAKDIIWTAPGLLCGNEIGSWTDAAGSMQRRLFVVEFNEAVPKDVSDTNLHAKIKDKVGLFLRKANLAYLEKAHRFGQFDIWKTNVLPPALHEFNKNVRMQVDGLESFMCHRRDAGIGLLCTEEALREQHCSQKEAVFMDFADFKQRYLRYRAAEGYPKITLDKDHFLKGFSDWGITIENSSKRYVDDKLQTKTWAIGVMPDPSIVRDDGES